MGSATLTSGTLAGSSTANGRPNIPLLLDEQSSSLVGLHKIISEMEQRLTAVLSHDVPKDAANRQNPPTAIQISERLVTHNHLIDFAQQRLGELMQRLHL